MKFSLTLALVLSVIAAPAFAQSYPDRASYEASRLRGTIYEPMKRSLSEIGKAESNRINAAIKSKCSRYTYHNGDGTTTYTPKYDQCFKLVTIRMVNDAS